MPFSVSQMIVDSQEKVVALNWAYSNADGTLSNQHKLLEPYGTTPLHQVTEELAVGLARGAAAEHSGRSLMQRSPSARQKWPMPRA